MSDDRDAAGAHAADLPRDADEHIRPEFVAQVADAIERGDAATLRAMVSELHEADTGDLIEALDPALRPRLVEIIGADFDFTALTEVDDTIREEILEELPAGTVAAGVRELESDDAVYLLEDLPQENQTEILQQLPPPERVALERSLYYPEDSAGRRMQTEFIAVPAFWTVGQTIDHMRDAPDLPERFFEVYAIDPAHRLVGAVTLDRILRSKRPIAVSELADPERRRVRATDDQEEVARLFERYNLVAAPVVDSADRLVGVITVDDVMDVISEETEEDVRALGGVGRHEELSQSVWSVARSRFTWLFTNLLTALLAAWVISWFENSLQKMVALAVLMPVVSDMGGNAGTQTMTVAVRALATRELTSANAWRIIRREMMVGALNGLAFAVIMGIIAVGWFRVTDLGPVIGLAMLIVLSAAALGGIIIPLTLSRIGVDPAVASGPFVTTITDVIGFFSFLGIATLWFGFN
jgi:magnesium transporter